MPAKIHPAALATNYWRRLALPTLLCIHGFPLYGSFWQPQVQGLGGAAHVRAPDLRGFGADRRPVPEVMTMEAFAEDLMESDFVEILSETGHEIVEDNLFGALREQSVSKVGPYETGAAGDQTFCCKCRNGKR